MNITLQGTNLDLTDEIRSFVDNKMSVPFETLGSVDRDPVTVDIELEKTTRRHPNELEDQRMYRAEANVSVPGTFIRAEGSSNDLYQAIVEMTQRLTRNIRDWREQLIDERRSDARAAKEELRTNNQPDESRYDEEIDEFGSEAE